MAYSQGLKTRFIDPQYHNATSRTEFRLPGGTTYASNLRLTNIGGVLVAGPTPAPPNSLCGLLGAIKNIYLYQGGTLVDQRREFGRWAAFHMTYNRSNEYNTNMGRSMAGHAWGYDIDLRAGVVTGAGPDPANMTDNATSTATAVLYLKDVFGFLRSVDWIPDSMAPLTVVIEWNMAAGTVSASRGVASFLQPVLVADYTDDPKMAVAAEKALAAGIAYDSTVYDLAYVPGITPTAGAPLVVQQQSLRPRGMDGLTVKRLLVVAEPTAGLSDLVGSMGSSSRFRGVDRFIVNGAQVHGYEGLGTEARRLQVLSDAYGPTNSFPGLGQPTAVNAAFQVNTPAGLVGEVSYTGLSVGEVVTDLQHEWQRTGVYNAAAGAGAPQLDQIANRPLTLHYFGDVTRMRTANGMIVEM